MLTAPVLVTQRVNVGSNHAERRDCLDQQWSRFLSLCGLLPVLLPNHTESACGLYQLTNPVGLLLTGGNDLVDYGGDAPERDQTELALLEQAIAQGLPVIGVCRGMQLIMHYFGSQLYSVDGHVQKRQNVLVNDVDTELNSYHQFACTALAELPGWAFAHDGVVKAVRHVQLPLMGIMWHPERFSSPRQADVALFRSHFGLD